MPFDHLLFFGGCEDPFTFPILKNGRVDNRIFRWDHETDSRKAYAFGLTNYFLTYFRDHHDHGIDDKLS